MFRGLGFRGLGFYPKALIAVMGFLGEGLRFGLSLWGSMSIRVGSTDSKSRVMGRAGIYSTGFLCLTRSPRSKAGQGRESSGLQGLGELEARI